MAATPEAPKMKATLGLTGVTVNAMALIAPGAFLWITFVVQAGYAVPSGMAMWAGIFAALLLAYATAVSYSELAKLYPGAGSSYLFAEKAFPNSINAGVPGPVFMALIAVIFSFAVAWIAFQGVNGSTMVNIAINGIQIVALLFFSALAIAYRMSHPAGAAGLGLDPNGNV